MSARQDIELALSDHLDELSNVVARLDAMTDDDIRSAVEPSVKKLVARLYGSGTTKGGIPTSAYQQRKTQSLMKPDVRDVFAERQSQGFKWPLDLSKSLELKRRRK